MKVWFKRILISLVLVAIVALVGLAIFLLTFDPNAYKSKLEEIVYNRYHRTLAIEGDIELSLFPRIGLSVQGVSLSDRDSASTFASIDSARFAVAIWPLLSNRLVVDHVAVTGFKAWVTRNKEGEFNFHDLIERNAVLLNSSTVANADLATAQPTASKLSGKDADAQTMLAVLTNPQTSHTDFQIDIAGLTLKDGEIHLYDAITGSVARIVKLDVDTGRMTFDQPFDVALKGKLTGDYPIADANIEGQALVKMNPEQKTYSAQKLNVQVAGRLGPLQAKAVSLRGNLAYSAYSRMFSASSLELLVQGDINGKQPIKNLNASLSVPQLKINQSQAEVQIEKLALRAKGEMPDQNFDIALDAPSLAISPETAKSEAISATVKLTGDSVLGVSLGLGGLGGNAHNLTLKELKIQGGLKQGDRLIQLNVSSPAKWDTWKDLGGLSAIKGDVKIEAPALPNGSFEFPLIGSVRADLAKDKITSDINAVLNGSKLDFSAVATQLHDPKVTFDLAADSLDFNTLFPPTVAKEAAAEPEKAGDKPAPAAAKAAQAKAAPKKTAPADAVAKPKVDTPIDLSMLDSIDVTGKIKLGAIKIRGFKAKNVNAAVRAAKGKLEVSKITADLYHGTLNGNVTADANNVMATQLSLDGVSVGDLLKGLTHEDRFSGTGTIHMNLQTQGATQAALVAGLRGSLQANLRDGAFKGLDVAQTLREMNEVVRNVFSGQVPDVATKFDMGRQTDFTSLDTQVVFDKGRGTLKKLDIAAPLLRIVAGSPATIDLVNNTLDVLFKVRVVNTLAGQDGKDLAVLKGVTVPVLISGPMNAPGYQIQWKDIGGRVVKQAVQDGLLDLLAQKPGEKQAPDSAAAPAKAAPVPAPKKPLDAVKSIGDALKGLLGQ